MRTTLDLPAELIRHRRIEELKALSGHIDLKLDMDGARKRPSKPAPRKRRAKK